MVPLVVGAVMIWIGVFMICNEALACSYERSGLGGWVAFAGFIVVVAAVFEAFATGG